MQLSDLRNHLRSFGPENIREIVGFNKNQVFGYVEAKEKVAICGIEYNVEMQSRPNCDTVAPALIFDDFSNRDDIERDRYVERKEMCIELHKAIRSAGYTLVAAVWHAHAEGDMVRCEYYKAAGDGWTGTSLQVVYTPSDYMPEGAIIVPGKHTTSSDDVYYTVSYEEGQLTYLSASSLSDGRPIRRITINGIEGQCWHGEKMNNAFTQQLAGLHVDRVVSMTKSESQEGWKRTYVGNLTFTKEPVEVTIENFHWNSN
jgi:hypothetical protein